MTGGCSGALRQEFRELELLDEITKSRFIGKLPPIVNGDTRNAVISSFRKWKGIQYVPEVVHPAIRWSKRDPLLKTQADSYDFAQLRLKYDTVVAAKSKNAANHDKLEVTPSSDSTLFNAPATSSTTSPNAPAILHPRADLASQGTKRC